MAGHPTGVHRNPVLELVEVLLESFPVPIDRPESGKGHAFNTAHHFLQVLGFSGSRAKGSEGEAAVAGDDRGDAVVRRWRRAWIPKKLRVVMSVDIDHAWHDHAPGCIGNDRCVAVDLADGDDLSVANGDIGKAAGGAGAINDRSALDDLVVACVGHSEHPLVGPPIGRCF